MFDRFTDNAKQLMSNARKEALRLQHEFIGPEHILLGLLQLGDTASTALLHRHGVEADTLRQALLAIVQPGNSPPPQLGALPMAPEAKRVLEAAVAESARLRHSYVGSQHLLIALVAVEETAPSQILHRLGVTLDALRQAADDINAAQRSHLRLLLISNSTMHGGGYLAHCAAEIADFLGGKTKVLFVPYALHDHDAYTRRAREAFAAWGHELVSVHEHSGRPTALEDVGAVFIGGGNTFRLLTALYHYGLLQAIQQRVLAGMPYIGSSAGTNVATLSIRTTNDMPIVQPPSFTAMQLVPFQINPHYLDPDPNSKHMGETREERLRQFHEEHDTPVLGMREGCMLRVEGRRAELRGTTQARLFRRGQAAQEFTPVCDLSFLLQD